MDVVGTARSDRKLPFEPESTTLNAAIGLESKSNNPELTRVPHFILANRSSLLHDDEVRRLNVQIDDLNQKIKFRERDLAVAHKKTMQLKQTLVKYENEIESFKSQILDLKDSLSQANEVKDDKARTSEREVTSYKNEIAQLKVALDDATKAIDKLSIFKTDSIESEPDKARALVSGEEMAEFIVEPQSLAEHDIKEAYKLHTQLAELVNAQIEEYEQGVKAIRRKRGILREIVNSRVNNDKERAFDEEETQLTENYHAKVKELRDEQELLQNHQNGLLKIKERYNADKEHITVKRTADQALKKYSAKAYVSCDNGQSYRSVKNVEMCTMCNDRTMVCPHRVFHGLELPLPPKATHIKLLQPKLRIKDPRVFSNVSLIDRKVEVTISSDTSDTFKVIWKRFALRGGSKPICSRNLSLETILALITEICDKRAEKDNDYEWQDVRDVLPTFHDYFYSFLQQRYVVPDLTHNVIHDFFFACQQYENVDSRVALFCRTLAGFDNLSWKYLRFVSKLLSRYNSFENINNYRDMIHILYPDRKKEDYDHMELDVVAFNKSHKLTKENIEELIRLQILKKTEPNYRLFYHKLKKYDFTGSGVMSCKQFEECMAMLLGDIVTHVIRNCYRATALDFSDPDSVTLERCTHITAYLSLSTAAARDWQHDVVPQPIKRNQQQTGGNEEEEEEQSEEAE